ncbi:MAG: hypothetical protein GY948_08170 [Alphaproteobacteria bacterium]|nr:hypothetical protein [Alphaproteobacteria bacterium]
MENLFRNIAPFVVEISLALVVVFVISFAAGWVFARLPVGAEDRKER